MDEGKYLIRRYWDQRSSTFDLSPGHRISSKLEEDAWKDLFQEKLGYAGKKVLDVGAGTGFLSVILAEMGYSVVGIDISEEMLKNARKKMEDKGLAVRLEIGDAEELPFEDESFDAVVNRAVLWTLPDPRRALAEWKRVLRPGGMLCFFLHGPHQESPNPLKQLSNLMILLGERRNPWRSLRDSVRLPLGKGASPSEITSLLRTVGYVNVSSEPMTAISQEKWRNMPWYHRLSSHKSVQYCYTGKRPLNKTSSK